jgi:hypothetical protein
MGVLGVRVVSVLRWVRASAPAGCSPEALGKGNFSQRLLLR